MDERLIRLFICIDDTILPHLTKNKIYLGIESFNGFNKIYIKNDINLWTRYPWFKFKEITSDLSRVLFV